jgi:hypothetical protein
MTVNLTVAPADLGATSRRQVAAYAGPASYVTGGDPMVPADVRMGKLFAVLGTISNGTAVLIPWWNTTTGTLLFFVPNTGAQVANGVDLSTYVGNLEFIGQ